MMDRLLGPPLTEAERAAVIEEARALLGTKWRHQGFSARGVDCRGLAWLAVARALKRLRGVDLPPPRKDYPRRAYQRELRQGLIEWLGQPVAGPPLPGDILTMRWTGDEHHVAIVVPHPFHPFGVIHADNTAAGGARVVEHGSDYVWDRRLVEIFRP